MIQKIGVLIHDLEKGVNRVVDFDAILATVLLAPPTVLLIADGMLRVSDAVLKAPSAARVVIGGLELLACASIIWFTVARWAKWIAAFLGLGALNAAIEVVTGAPLSPWVRPIPRAGMVTAALFAAVAAALCYPFISRKPQVRERLSLVVFLGACLPVVFFSAFPRIRIASAAVGLVVLAWGRLSSDSRTAVQASRQMGRKA